jgi:hypothetical protein
MAHPITADPDPMSVRTSGDGVLELAVMTGEVVIPWRVIQLYNM